MLFAGHPNTRLTHLRPMKYDGMSYPYIQTVTRGHLRSHYSHYLHPDSRRESSRFLECVHMNC